MDSRSSDANVDQGMNRPPVTSNIAPVMKDASSEHRKAIALATSDGSPYRFIGIVLVKAAIASSDDAPDMAVWTGPGETQFAVMPCGAASSASVLLNPISPALLAA